MRSSLFSSMNTRFSFVIVIILILIVSLSAILSIIRHILILQNTMNSKGILLVKSISHFAENVDLNKHINEFESYFEDVVKDEHVLFASIISNENRILVHNDKSKVGLIIKKDQWKSYSLQPSGILIGRTIEPKTGKELLLVEKNIPGQPNHIIRVGMTRVPLTEAIKIAWQYYLSKVLIIGLIGIFISIILSQKITNPLRKLVDDVEKISQGELSHEVISAERDEIGQLSIAFNEMRISLKQKIEVLDRTITELSSIHELGTVITSVLEQGKLMNVIIQSVIKGLKFDKVILLLVSDDGKYIEHGKGEGFSSSEMDFIKSLRIPLFKEKNANDESVLVEILKDGLPMKQNPQRIPHLGIDGKLADLLGNQSFLIQPMIAQRRRLGVLIATSSLKKGELGEVEKDALKNLANYASVALDNARLYKQNAEKARMEEELKHAREIEQAYNELEKKNILLQNTMKELKNAQEQLLSTSRLAAVGELSGRVAHEVLNPITAMVTRIERMIELYTNKEFPLEKIFYEIVTEWKENFSENGSLDNYLSQKDPDGDGKTYGEEDLLTLSDLVLAFQERHYSIMADLDFLRHHTFRVIKIVDSLRAMSRISTEIEEVSVNETIREALELMHDGFNKRNIEIQQELTPNLPLVLANYSELIQVFSNLLKNSMQAIEPKRKGKVFISTKVNKNKIEILISDDGSGIEAQYVNRIFDADFSTKSREEGTGLGLSLSRRFVREFGGNIILKKTSLNEGTDMLITLPIKLETRAIKQTK